MKKYTNVGDVLDAVMKHKGFVTKTALAELLEISSQALSNWYRRNTIDADLVKSKLPELNYAWILTGEGSMLSADKDSDIKTISDFIPNGKDVKKIRDLHNLRQIDLANKLGVSDRTVQNWEAGGVIPETKHEILRELLSNKSDLRNNSEAEKGRKSLDTTKGRPFYNVDFTLGFEGLDNDITLYPEFNIDFPPANRDTVNWFRARGNSMLGEINSGDYIALEEIEDFSWISLGKIHAVVTNNGFRTIKRVLQSDIKEEYLLVSSNPNKTNYPDQTIPKEIITKLYKVVHAIRDLEG